MPTKDTSKRTKRRKKETTLREAVVACIELFLELYGPEVTMKKFDEMKLLFSHVQDWPDIEKEVTEIMLSRKRQDHQDERERQQRLEDAWVEGLAKGVNGNQVNLLTGSNPQAPYNIFDYEKERKSEQ